MTMEIEQRAKIIVDKIIELWEYQGLGAEKAERLLDSVLEAFPELNKLGTYAFRMWDLADTASLENRISGR